MASQDMDVDECSVKTLETKTRCHLFSERCIAKITDYQWDRNLPDPADWNAHDDAVLDLLERIDKQTHGQHPRVIADAIRRVLNNELQDEPELLAHLIAYLGFILDGRLRRDE